MTPPQNDPQFGICAAKCLVQHLPDGLVLCPITYIELAPEFSGDSALQEQFFQRVGVQWLEPWSRQDTLNAHRLWANYVEEKRSGLSANDPSPTCSSRRLLNASRAHYPQSQALYERARGRPMT